MKSPVHRQAVDMHSGPNVTDGFSKVISFTLAKVIKSAAGVRGRC